MRNHDNNNHVIANLLKASAAISIGIFLVACSDDSNKTSGGSVEDQEVIAITDKTISGVSQKGPFVNGSSVTVQELDGETLAQTGASYEGKIKNDMGEFSVKVAKLVSQYALLKANGFYRNEVTGEKSKSQVTLYALTDISNRDEVNVNLLTHLEYERSLYLAADDSVTVAAAKKQAEKEVLATFGITGDFANSEDLNIFGTDDGAAALLAISVLMQGDLSEADFSERLADYAADIETDGKWDDAKTATEIADWGAAKSLGKSLSYIRVKITDWGISADVPAFEKYVDNYWWQNYNLGTCSEKREGEVKKNDNSQSRNYSTYFICENSAWWVASDTEYDTYQQKCDKDGKIVYGNVNKDFAYDCDVKNWRHASAVEAALGGCIEKRFDEVAETGGVHYICQNREWRTATDIEKDTYKWQSTTKGAKDGDVKYGDVVKTNCYVYENATWRSGNATDCSFGLRGCTALRQDTVGLGTDKVWHICDAKSWRTATDIEKDTTTWGAGKFDGEIRTGQVNTSIYYIYEVDKKVWRNATTLEKDVYKQKCSEDGKYFFGNVNKTTKYVCDNATFRTLNNIELEADSACTSYNRNEYYILPKYDGLTNYSYYKCTANGWMFTTEKLNQGTLTDDRDGHEYKTIGIKSQMWMSENLNYKYKVYDIQQGDSILFENACGESDVDCLKYGRFYTWNAARKSCPEGWHLPSHQEWKELLDAVGIKKYRTSYTNICGSGYCTFDKPYTLLAREYEEWSDATDEYGFSVRPYPGDGSIAHFWSSSASDAYYAFLISFHPNEVWLFEEKKDIGKSSFLSVRCIRDE